LIQRRVVWPSGWVRTFFFNPTRSDEQDPKPSLRTRTPELAQSSGSNKVDHSGQFVEQDCLFSSIRRTKFDDQS
jgi:hypothetical protein